MLTNLSLNTPPIGRLVRVAACVALVCLLGLAHARADVVELTSGRRIEGIIQNDADVDLQKTSLIVLVGEARLTFPPGQVKSLQRARPAENSIIAARTAIQAGKPDRAAQAIAEALDQSARPEDFSNLILDMADPLAGIAAGLGSARQEQFTLLLDNLKGAGGPRADWLAARRAQLYLALGRFDRAAEALAPMQPEFFAAQPPVARPLAEALLALLKTRIDDKDYDGALRVIDSMAHVDPELATARKLQFYLQWASAERRGGNYESALKIYAEKMLPDAPEIARDRIAMTLGEAEQTLRAKDDLAGAALLYERYGVPNSAPESVERLVQLWRDQGGRLMRRKEFKAAREAFEKANSFKEDSAKADLLRLEYQERRDRIATGDSAELFDLGLWATDHDLPQEALTVLDSIRKDSPMAAKASVLREQIENQLAEKELLRLSDLYEKGQYVELLQSVHTFQQEPHPAGYLAQAHELEELTKETMRVQAAERPQQADAMLQQAQRAFYQERYAEAEKLLENIVHHYRDTVAYSSALNMLALVREKRNLERLEEGSHPVDHNEATSHSLARRQDEPTTPSAGKELDQLTRTLGRMKP